MNGKTHGEVIAMEDNKRYGDDDFLNTETNGGKQQDEGEKPAERTATYYSYGPYKSISEPEHTTSTSESGVPAPVEVTAPKPVRPFGQEQSAAPAMQPRA